MIPTVCPPSRANAVINERPKRGLNSSISPSSTIRSITRCMSYARCRRVGTKSASVGSGSA